MLRKTGLRAASMTRVAGTRVPSVPLSVMSHNSSSVNKLWSASFIGTSSAGTVALFFLDALPDDLLFLLVDGMLLDI